MKASGGCLLFVLVVFVFGVLPGMICWPYTINTWLVFTGHPATVVWWQGGLIGLCPVIGQATIPGAIVTWILMLFI
jgi:hypothetical protein